VFSVFLSRSTRWALLLLPSVFVQLLLASPFFASRDSLFFKGTCNGSEEIPFFRLSSSLTFNAFLWSMTPHCVRFLLDEFFLNLPDFFSSLWCPAHDRFNFLPSRMPFYRSAWTLDGPAQSVFPTPSGAW